MSLPTLLCLHGWTMDGSLFADLAHRLEGRAQVLAPDLPGHGGCDPQRPATLEGCSAFIKAQLDEIQGPVVLLGWSMGAAAAWRFLQDHGQARVAGLITVDMSPRITCTADWPLGLKGQSEARIAAATARFESDWHASAPVLAKGMFAEGRNLRDVPCAPELIAKIRAQEPAKMVQMWRSLVEMDARPLIPSLTLPWSLCAGARSRVYPLAVADWLTSKAPQATLEVFETSGHSPLLEEPEAFAQSAAAFLARIG